MVRQRKWPRLQVSPRPVSRTPKPLNQVRVVVDEDEVAR